MNCLICNSLPRLVQSRSTTASFYVMDVGPNTLKVVGDATGYNLKADPIGIAELIV